MRTAFSEQNPRLNFIEGPTTLQTQGASGQKQSTIQSNDKPKTGIIQKQNQGISIIQSHTDNNHKTVGPLKKPPATQISAKIESKPSRSAPTYSEYLKEKTNPGSSSLQGPQDNATTKPNQNSVETKDSTPSQEPQKEIKQKTSNQNLVNNLNKITSSLKYKTTLHSSKRRQMILNSLPESINDATLDSILKDERCSRGVKTALLLSPDLTYEQKLKVVNSAKNNEIVAYCQKHKNVFPQVRSALTPTSKVKQGSTQFISKNSPTNLKSFVNAFFDQNGQFTTPDDIKDAKAFFNPSTFTIEERARIVELLKEKKKEHGLVQKQQNINGQIKTLDDQTVIQETKIRNLKIDMMIAQFTEPWDEGLTQKFKIFDDLTNDVINTLESSLEEAAKTDDSRETKHFLKNPEEIYQKLSYIEGITLVLDQFQSPNESFPNSAIQKGNVMIAQQYPRLELLIKEACKKDVSAGHIDRVLNEIKTALIDFKHGLKVVFVAKKCSEFIESNKGKTENDFFTKIIKEYAIELNGELISEVSALTKTKAKEVTQLAQALGYKETQ